MSKELEELYNWIYCNCGTTYEDDVKLDEIRKNIDEALQRLEVIDKTNPSKALELVGYLKDYHLNTIPYQYWLDDIEQYILKAQTNDEILQKYYQEGITLDSVRALKQERDKYKKALNIIKKKRIDMWHLIDLLDQTYEMYLAFCKSEGYENDYILTKEEFVLLREMLKNE